ncbi:MAG: bifunctional 5,10-methylenetetrahydrofolate dehydrogenase/5,10-methenyltetrahydrofolate cyclohydrolase [Planctomycetota bacterium]|nr:bifunctional 5,10-methylenetetrahydrofolate dehydrogenase/5,10-methenyltetrahydrofolate cyclohydrolase [Planctomycetota bacterium]
MSSELIDGKAIAAEMRSRISNEIAALNNASSRPCLATVVIGDDPSAASYARSQAKHAASVGLECRRVELAADSDMATALKTIESLNADDSVSGIILQMPVPAGLNGFALQQAIAPVKDVEGVGPANFGLLAMGSEALVPCTAAAAFACLNSTGVDLRGLEAVVVGRSVIVGKPIAMLLLSAHATVTQCHTRTRDLISHTRRAEILVVAAGVARLIGAEHVSPGAIVIDVGMHRIVEDAPDGTRKTGTVGDVRFEEVAPMARAITPVPGGVGPVTVAMLLANTVKAYRRSLET